MTWKIIKLAIAAAVFAGPAVYIIKREWSGAKGEGQQSDRLSFKAFLRVTAVLVPLVVPVAFLTSSYSFYSPKDSALKVAFKHTGKRIVDCDENELIKKAGERYRKELKDTTQVQMNIAGLAGCPRERHPVVVGVDLDGRPLLDKGYSPTGLKKDMASYIYEEFIIAPGEHRIAVRLYDRGHKEAPDFAYEGSFTVKPHEIKLVRFDDKSNTIVVE